MSKLFLCTWFSQKLNRLKIDNINIDGKVTDFKKVATHKLDKNIETIEFVYRGLILNDEKLLSDYGIKDDSDIHVVERSTLNIPSKSKGFSEEDVQSLVSSFRVFTQNPGFRSTVQRIVRSGVFEEMRKAVPEILHDTTAVAIVLDPELLIHLVDPDTVRLLGERHPSLIKAAYFLSKHLREQNNTPSHLPTTSTGYSYSLDALSDDEDMDSNSDSNRESHPLTRNTSYNAITSAQLAAAIASATNTAFNTNSAGMPTSPSNSSTLITNEMFSNAMQHAFASSPGAATPLTPSRTEGESNLNTLIHIFDQQLRQMHEIGLVDDRINIRALQTTSGDLQAAIELVFNGIIE